MTICGQDITDALQRLAASGSSYRLAVMCVGMTATEERSLDIGYEMSQLVARLKQTRDTSESIFYMELSADFENIIKSHTFESEEFGPMVIMCNPGILFEPELHIDIIGMLRRISKNTLTVLLWPGQADQTKLYFLDRKSIYTINQTDINYMLI